MRVSQAALMLALVGGAQSFTTTASFGVTKAVRPLFMSEGDAEESVADKAPAASAPKSGLTMKSVRKTIDGLTSDNFSSSLSTIEPFLLNEAGATMYSKSMRRIAVKAKALGVEVPEGYVKEAKATEKKRQKQDAFIKMKEEERGAAEAEATEAEAEAAEEPPAEEAASEETVEELAEAAA